MPSCTFGIAKDPVPLATAWHGKILLACFLVFGQETNFWEFACHAWLGLGPFWDPKYQPLNEIGYRSPDLGNSDAKETLHKF